MVLPASGLYQSAVVGGVDSNLLGNVFGQDRAADPAVAVAGPGGEAEGGLPVVMGVAFRVDTRPIEPFPVLPVAPLPEVVSQGFNQRRVDRRG